MGLAVVAIMLVSIYFVLNIATVLYCIWSWWRSPEISEGEQQRGNMRSCSWPTADGAAFAANAWFHSKAEPTLVNGQVTD
jgi:hypothetical protein